MLFTRDFGKQEIGSTLFNLILIPTSVTVVEHIRVKQTKRFIS